MRRKGFATSKRQKIVQSALAQLRETRGQINPALLKKVRDVIQVSENTAKEPQKWVPGIEADAPDMVPVDRKKIYETAFKFLELCPNNKALRKEVLTYINSQN